LFTHYQDATISLCCISHLFPPTVSPFKKFIKIIDSHLIDYFRYKNMHFTTNSKKLSSHQLKGNIHLIIFHIKRIKAVIDTVKKSSKKNLYYVSYFMSAYIVWKFNINSNYYVFIFHARFYTYYVNCNKIDLTF
jgi:hypothetical protein